MYFDAVVVEVEKNLLLFRLALAILCVVLSLAQRKLGTSQTRIYCLVAIVAS